jgi:hypothetical protein
MDPDTILGKLRKRKTNAAGKARIKKFYKKSLIDSGILPFRHSLRNTVLFVGSRGALPEEAESFA